MLDPNSLSRDFVLIRRIETRARAEVNSPICGGCGSDRHSRSGRGTRERPRAFFGTRSQRNHWKLVSKDIVHASPLTASGLPPYSAARSLSCFSPGSESGGLSRSSRARSTMELRSSCAGRVVCKFAGRHHALPRSNKGPHRLNLHCRLHKSEHPIWLRQNAEIKDSHRVSFRAGSAHHRAARGKHR